MSEQIVRKLTVIEGRAVPVAGHDVDTDRIIPARFLKAISFEGLEAHVFEDDRQQARQKGGLHPFDQPAFQGARILFVNRNFGCGSSREHAPQALKRWGIDVVIGESYSEIYFGNSLALGMPCLSVPHKDADWLIAQAEANPQANVSVDVTALTISMGDRVIKAQMPKSAQEALITGAWDATGALLEDFDRVKATASRLPYVAGF
jgi:3-isopropylmalate/(R)-2-methylmalate dehydratase small subunit